MGPNYTVVREQECGGWHLQEPRLPDRAEPRAQHHPEVGRGRLRGRDRHAQLALPAQQPADGVPHRGGQLPEGTQGKQNLNRKPI